MTDADKARYLLALESPPTHQASLGTSPPPSSSQCLLVTDCLWGGTQMARLHWGGQRRDRRREGHQVNR